MLLVGYIGAGQWIFVITCLPVFTCLLNEPTAGRSFMFKWKCYQSSHLTSCGGFFCFFYLIASRQSADKQIFFTFGKYKASCEASLCESDVELNMKSFTLKVGICEMGLEF